MYYVYILQNKEKNQIYIGFTNDLKRRFKEYNEGKMVSIKRYTPWDIFYYEAYKEEKLARLREKRLKHNGNAIRELKKRIGLSKKEKASPSTTFGATGTKSGAGFTLIELLLYVSIISVFLLGVVFFSSVLLEARTKNQVIAEVEQQGNQVLHIITQTVRNAQDVNLPAVGSSGSTLSLGIYETTKNPTIFDLDNGVVTIKEGVGSAVNLTNSRVNVSDITFSNVSRANTTGIIKIEFTLDYINPENRQEFEYSRIFRASASLK